MNKNLNFKKNFFKKKIQSVRSPPSNIRFFSQSKKRITNILGVKSSKNEYFFMVIILS